MDLKTVIRTIPDYPKPGIMFRDITTLIQDAAGFAYAVDELARPYHGEGFTAVAGIEARGFIFGAAVARALDLGFVPVRKKGKLPAETLRQTYALEYGEDEIEVHAGCLDASDKVLVIDDLIATGGTANAAVQLIRRMGAEVAGAAFVIDLPELGGSQRLRALDIEVRTLVEYDGH